MTKEELEKEAEEWLLKNSGYSKNEFHGRKAIKAYIAGAETREKRIASLKETNKKISDECHKLVNSLEKLQNENAELKAKVGLSIDCEKAQKNGELCLGYGGDEDEPCEKCKNCIKCECGYYQLGETEKDEQLTKSKEIIRELLDSCFGYNSKTVNYEVKAAAEAFLEECGE